MSFGLRSNLMILFEMLMIISFPMLGRALNLSDMAYDLWTGTAVNDTSSVVAAGYAFSEAAGDFATLVRLTGKLTIIPVVLIFSLIINHLNRQKEVSITAKTHSYKISSLLSWFILAFVAMSILNNIGFIPVAVSAVMKSTSKFFMLRPSG